MRTKPLGLTRLRVASLGVANELTRGDKSQKIGNRLAISKVEEPSIVRCERTENGAKKSRPYARDRGANRARALGKKGGSRKGCSCDGRKRGTLLTSLGVRTFDGHQLGRGGLGNQL